MAMTADLKNRVLFNLSEALHDEDANLLHDLDVHEGWGDVIYVTIHSGISPPVDHRNRLRALFETAVDNALRPNRHLVDIKWSRGRVELP